MPIAPPEILTANGRNFRICYDENGHSFTGAIKALLAKRFGSPFELDVTQLNRFQDGTYSVTDTELA